MYVYTMALAVGLVLRYFSTAKAFCLPRREARTGSITCYAGEKAGGKKGGHQGKENRLRRRRPASKHTRGPRVRNSVLVDGFCEGDTQPASASRWKAGIEHVASYCQGGTRGSFVDKSEQFTDARRAPRKLDWVRVSSNLFAT